MPGGNRNLGKSEKTGWEMESAVAFGAAGTGGYSYQTQLSARVQINPAGIFKSSHDRRRIPKQIRRYGDILF